MLSTSGEFQIVGEASDGLSAIRGAQGCRPDLVLMDLSMPKMGGLDAISEIKRRFSDIKVLVLTVHKAEEYIYQSLSAGADGYLLKDAAYDELKMAIATVLDGKPYISPSISGKLVEAFLQDSKFIPAARSAGTLTSRERQVVKLIAEGYKNKEIAKLLCISIKTVEKHRANVMKKLDLHNASAITAYALEKGIIDT